MKKTIALLAAGGILLHSAPAAENSAVCAAETSEVQFRYTIDNGGITLTGASGAGDFLDIPSNIDGLPVTDIAEGFFTNSNGLIFVNLPDSLVTIGKKAFSNCSQLISVHIGSGTVSIDEQAFSACPKLQKIDVSADNKIYHSEIGSLYKDDSLLIYAGSGSAVIAPTTVSIGKFAFFGKTELSSVEIPYGMKAIGDYAFAGCLALTNADIPDTVTSIGDACFLSCTALDAVHLGGGLTTIPDSCFHGCTALKIVHIPDSVTVIKDYAFYSCDSLVNVLVPPSVDSIGTDALGRKFVIRSNSVENIPNFTIKGSIGSAAQRYAASMNMLFIEEGERKVVTGDVNSDNIIDGKDATITLTEYAKLSAGKAGTFTAAQRQAADFNKDSTVDGKDASAILAYYAKNSVQADS